MPTEATDPAELPPPAPSVQPAVPAAPARSPRVLAVIPARGGSKGVPAKNLEAVGGVPLVARAVRACRGARRVTDIAVSTDDERIATAAREAGADVVLRPAEIAGDTATSEAAVLHALDAYRGTDVVLLVQCTSPFLTSEEIDGVAAAVTDGGADTALTVAPTHGFVWREEHREEHRADGSGTDTAGTGHAGTDKAGTDKAGTDKAGTETVGTETVGVNHDKAFRPRRQDRPQDFLETGAAYAMDAAGFRTARHRFFGETALVRTDPARVLEIDDPHDLARARALAPLLDVRTLPGRDDIDAVVLDFDGTQTDDRVLIDADGRETVAVHRGDGLGIAALRDTTDLKLLILSTEQNPVVAARARKLRVPVLHGIDRKDLALKQWCDEQGVAPERVLYVGNDVNDLPCFGLVGWPVAVAQAHDAVRGAARAVTTTPGGEGAIREIAAWLLGPTLNK
ncbi:acylneuraminate cytidylyltransferase [Streptomyces sp. SID10853]|uniref:acylneuraminate cytidylyltransferase n=1 Tax=Streptomyces sp. SID10853 TaxID=2706028 RepID=UPI0013BF4DB0|nr:acylneuraminate cytidylyltransferase [Streptomyces sp. SID10853]NDZ77161.1 acylneuraminate cytidylyltransferase [Streptomyces sp. SID10853]